LTLAIVGYPVGWGGIADAAPGWMQFDRRRPFWQWPTPRGEPVEL